MFRLSDDTGSGLVTIDVFRHTLNMLGAKLTPDEAQMVADRLAARADGLVDYEGLYRLLLETSPPQVFTTAERNTCAIPSFHMTPQQRIIKR